MKHSGLLALLMLCSLVASAESLPPPAVPKPDSAAAPPDEPHSLDNRAELESFLDGVLRAGMEEHHVSGAVVAIVKDGQVLFSKGYGFKDLETHEPVDPRTTLFRIGSTTKLFTWTAVMQLVEQGKIDLDADVNKYLKGVQLPAAYGKPVTMRDLMTHTAGFEEGFLGYLIQDDPAKQQPILQAMQEHMPARVRPPGEMSAYSNYGAALAGLIVEQVSGMPYNEYIQKNIFDPLDMQYAAVQEPVPQRLSAYVGTSYKQENGAPSEQKYEIVGGFRPAGSGAVSALDMTHFMLAHLQDGRYGDKMILSPQTAQKMHTTAFRLDRRMPGMALGFYHVNVNGLDGFGHGGDTNYCHTEMLLVPSRGVGLFLSFYTEDNRVRDLVTDAFFDRYFPEQTKPAASVSGAAQAVEHGAGSYQWTRRNSTKIEKLLNLFTQISVAPLKDGNLVVAGLWREPRQFKPVAQNLWRQIGGKAQLAFRTDASGNATHMFFDFLPFMPTERVPWYEKSGFWYTALALVFVAFLGQFARAYYCRSAIKAATVRERRAEWLATGTAGWALLTFAALGLSVALAGFDSVLSHIPASVKVSLVTPLVFVLLTMLLIIACVNAWRFNYWTMGRRVVFSLVALAATVLSLFFWQWNLLGWQFG
jgi:CubicO group peptidase (beta-lactamase class C family)